METLGAYTAERASALTGVPKSTIYYWAQKGPVAPSFSPREPKLWSFPDLLALRAVYWLRKPKDILKEQSRGKHVAISKRASPDIPRTSMKAVRDALRQLRDLDLEIFVESVDGYESTVVVTMSGEVLLRPPGEAPRSLDGQLVSDELLDLVAPLTTVEGTHGPNLLCPRPLLRIVPKKLGGAPHVRGTRIETQSLESLRASGYTEEGIVNLYPYVSSDAVRESFDLERQLRDNLRTRAAA